MLIDDEGSPRARALALTAHRVALGGLLVLAVGTALTLVQLLWLASGLPVPGDSPLESGVELSWGAAVTGLLFLAWLPAFVALVLGHRRAAFWLAVAALVASVTGVLGPLGSPDPTTPVSAALAEGANLLVSALLVATLAVPAPPVAREARRRWLLALVLGTVGTLGPASLFLLAPVTEATWLDWPGLCALAATAVGAMHLARGTAADRPPSWAPALAVLVAAALVLRLTSLPGQFEGPPELRLGAWIAVAQAVALVAVLVPLALRARRELGDLPD